VPALPSTVRIREVGPRDGFQNEPEVIPTSDKVRLIDMLAGTGLPRLEVTSFVRPDVIPQLADAAEVLAAVTRPADVSYSVLIPNERGLERALEQRDRFDEINVFLSATESHNKRNKNRTIAESLDDLGRTVARAREEGLRCEGVISVVFGCPYEGEVAPDRVLEIADALAEMGCEEVSFGDTTGMANPRQVGEFPASATERASSLRRRHEPRASLWAREQRADASAVPAAIPSRIGIRTKSPSSLRMVRRAMGVRWPFSDTATVRPPIRLTWSMTFTPEPPSPT